MIFHRTIPLFLSALAPLTAASFPVVPASAQVLSAAEVKGYWVETLERQRCGDAFSGLCREIAEGNHDLAAQLVSLNHNMEAWIRQGNAEMARQAAEELLSLRMEVAGKTTAV
jgi:hypothetical protein